jgi:glucan phosphoethanolaminetransferase (alkaline phosphatase superfamily)
VLIVVGLLCGLLAGGAMLFLAWRQAIDRNVAQARVLGVCGLMLLGSVGPLVTGVLNGLDPERMPQSGSPSGQWAAIFLTAGWAAWAINGFQDRAARIASGSWSVGARRFDDCMAGVSMTRLVACIPALVLIAGIAGMFISAVETQFHTLGVAERISAAEGQYHTAKVDWTTDVDILPAGEYWRVSLSASWLVGAGHGLSLAIVGLVVFGSFKLLRKRFTRPGLGASLIGLAGGIYVLAYARHGLAWVFEDEIVALGLFNLSNCGMTILGIIYGSLVAWNIIELCSRDNTPRDGKDMMRTILLSGILLGIGPAGRLGIRRRANARRSTLGDMSTIALACGISAVIIALLFLGSFPKTVDHTTRVAIFLAVVITLVTAYSACLLLPPRSRLWPVRSAMIVVLFVLAVMTMLSAMSPTKDHSTIRNMMYEHSAVSKNNLECWRRVYGTGWEMPAAQAPVVTPADPPLDSPILEAFRKEKPLVIFLIWDACRTDHMSFYGYKRKTTPRLDAMSDRLIRFDNVFAQATATSCSMRHLFTGRYSSRYMLKKTGIGPFFTNEMLVGGYHTLHLNVVGSDFNGISEVAFLRDMPDDLKKRVEVLQTGQRLKDTLNQGDLKQWISGAEKMRSDAEGQKPDRRVICYGEQDAGEKVDVLLDYLDNNRAAGTFAYVHMTDTHYPWKRHPNSPDWGDSHEGLYDGAIFYADRTTGALFDGLKARGLLDKTIVIIAADHGTGLGDHGKYAGFHPYYEQIHVPLIMHVPGVKAKTVKSLVGLFDIAPTLVSLAAPNLLAARNYEAMDLWPLVLRGERNAPRVIFGLNSFEDCYYRVGTDSLHYIWRRARGYDDLFDYVKDPRERTRKLLEDTDKVNRCRAEMTWFLKQGEGRYLDPLHYRVEDPPDRH